MRLQLDVADQIQLWSSPILVQKWEANSDNFGGFNGSRARQNDPSHPSVFYLCTQTLCQQTRFWLFEHVCGPHHTRTHIRTHTRAETKPCAFPSSASPPTHPRCRLGHSSKKLRPNCLAPPNVHVIAIARREQNTSQHSRQQSDRTQPVSSHHSSNICFHKQMPSFFLPGPLSGYLVARIGFRKTTIIGTLIGSAGVVSSAFVDSLSMAYFTFGILGGTWDFSTDILKGQHFWPISHMTLPNQISNFTQNIMWWFSVQAEVWDWLTFHQYQSLDFTSLTAVQLPSPLPHLVAVWGNWSPHTYCRWSHMLFTATWQWRARSLQPEPNSEKDSSATRSARNKPSLKIFEECVVQMPRIWCERTWSLGSFTQPKLLCQLVEKDESDSSTVVMWKRNNKLKPFWFQNIAKRLQRACFSSFSMSTSVLRREVWLAWRTLHRWSDCTERVCVRSRVPDTRHQECGKTKPITKHPDKHGKWNSQQILL